MKTSNIHRGGAWIIFRYRLTRYRGQILGWGSALALLGLFMAQFYSTIADRGYQFEQLLEAYPKELMAFFGDFTDLATPSGYLNLEYFVLMPLILGVFALLAGSGLLTSDEESGRLDLMMAHPITRTALFWGRLAAFVVATVAILVLAWLGLYIPTNWTPLDVGWWELTRAFITLLAVLAIFGTLALLLSLLLPSRRLAAMTSGLILVGSYFVTSLARVIDDLATIAKLSPLSYYQGGEAIDRFNVMWVVGLSVAAIVFALLAWRRFELRDIRVAGEGAWRRPALSSLARRLPKRVARQSQVPASEGAARGG
jgi:ABC-2 type transport system permease protein